jgi:hypothetical protein
VKRRTILAILLTYLLTSGLYLLSPGERAWAIPGQNPNRQSSPSRTPTPAATSISGVSTAAPVPQPLFNETPRPLSLPAETVTPLFLTLFPPTATPGATWESVLWQTVTAERRAIPVSTPFLLLSETMQPTPLQTFDLGTRGVAITPVMYPSLEDALGAGICVDLLVIGIGLVLLILGLVLVRGHRTSSRSQ